MKLRNKKTGEIVETDYELSISVPDDEKFYGCSTYNQIKGYNSLAELNEEWEDAPEEPEEFWYINECGDVLKYKYDGGCSCPILEAKEIGNYFETEEEAEKAVEKLKAWKRLKDKGFFFDGRTPVHDNTVRIRARVGVPFLTGELSGDLDLLFGGKE